MRNAAGKKLRSQTGASLLIALLYFLTAATVGAAALTAAATNAGRLARNRREQQDYLAVASAARLIEEDFREVTFRTGYQKTVVWVADELGGMTPTPPVYSKDPQIPVLTGGSRLLAGESRPVKDLEQLYFSTAAAGTALQTGVPAQMKYPLKITAEGLPDVLGAMEVDRAEDALYAITVTLYTQAEDGAPPANTVTLRFLPSVSDTAATTREYAGDTETVTTTYAAAVSWGAPVITKEAAA